MPRIRSIKPGFFTDDELAELPAITRLLFIGLWCVADREGRLEDRPAKIKAEILPYEKGSIDKLLTNLAEVGFIVRYEIGDRRFIQVTNFLKHQYPNKKEPASTIPAPCQHSDSTIPAPDEIVPRAPKGNCNMVNGSGNMGEGAVVVTEPPPQRTEIFGLYEQHIGTINPYMAEQLLAAEEEYSLECIRHAFEEATVQNVHRWAYVLAILKAHKDSGSCYDAKGELPTEDYDARQAEFLAAATERAKEYVRTHPNG